MVTADKKAIGSGWTGTPPPDTYRSFLARVDPERVAREERERVVADLLQRSSFAIDRWMELEAAGEMERAAKFAFMFYLRIEQLDALERIPLLFWCSACTPSETRKDEAQGALGGMDDRLPHALCLAHLDSLLRNRATERMNR